MTSKVLFVILIGCAVALASPINKASEAKHELKSVKILGLIADGVKSFFKQFVEQIGGAIGKGLTKIIDAITKRLDTPEFREAIHDLKVIMEKIYDDKEQLKVPDEYKKEVEEELKKVSTVFEQLVSAAITIMEKGTHEKADGTEFKKVVKHFKAVVDKIYPNQGTK